MSAPHDSTSAPSEPPAGSAARASILHVDDNDANRYAVSRSLRKAGFVVEEAASGREALAKVSTQRPDLLILDVRLPDMSGFEVCQQIKADPQTANIPVLHLSASFTSGRDKAHGLEMGADAYLVRPVEPMELVATVNALLRQRRAEDRLREVNAELTESERRYRFLADSMPQIVWTARADGSLDYVNQRWIEFTGFDLQAIAGEPAPARLFHPDDLAERNRIWEQAMRSGEAYQSEHRYRRADGQYRWHLVRAIPMRDAAGRITRWFGTSTDIDDQKQAREALRQARDEAQLAREAAESASRLKDEFLATLSHELRTPLNAVVGWAQLLRAGNVNDQDLREGLETIERNAKVQAQLIEDLLDVSRIISGKLRLDVSEIELASVIEAAIASMMPAVEAKGVRLQRVLDPGAAAVWGDPARLQQVVWNLLSNAVKFTPRGGRIAVTLARINSHVEIIVSDSGQGISPTFLPYVFERFRQADASTTRSHGGLGLGLAIVRQLVELHGGTVRAFSPGPGQGATFTVSLPLSAARDREPDRATRPAQPPPERQQRDDQEHCARLSGRQVLVVDDEPDARALIQRILIGCGAHVVVADSVPEALARLRSRRFDVMVSDIGMAGQDGYDLIRQVRQLPADEGGTVPAVALTAFARSEDRRRALVAGFNVHVAKPVEPLELIAVLATAAGKGR